MNAAAFPCSVLFLTMKKMSNALHLIFNMNSIDKQNFSFLLKTSFFFLTHTELISKLFQQDVDMQINFFSGLQVNPLYVSPTINVFPISL